MKLEDLAAPTDGAAILDDIHAAITRFVALPGTHEAYAVTLWSAATHAQPCWEHASRMVVKSPLKRCGKTRLLEVLGELCHRPLRTANISPAALVRSIDPDNPPTLMIDEADAIFAKRRGERSESAETIRGIINAGHGRGASYLRWDAASRLLDACPTFAMACLAAIGDLPDTIEDRGPVIVLKRRAPSETVELFRRRSIPALHELRDQLAGWIARVAPELEVSEPDLPVTDRAADVWEPLVAVADAAGGEWPARARAACTALTEAAGEPDDATVSERLLSDLHAVFGTADRMMTAEILAALQQIEEAPWSDWYGHPLHASDLARLLRPYGVKSKVIRVASATPRGYSRHDLKDAWGRYTCNSRNTATSGSEEALSELE